MDNYDFEITVPAGAPHSAETLGLMLLEGQQGKEYSMGGYKPERFVLTSDLNYRSVSTEDELPLAMNSTARGIGQKREFKNDSQMYMQGINVDTGGVDYWTHAPTYAELTNHTNVSMLSTPFRMLIYSGQLYIVDENGFVYYVLADTLREKWVGTQILVSETAWDDSEAHGDPPLEVTTTANGAPTGTDDCAKMIVKATLGASIIATDDIDVANYNAMHEQGGALWIKSSLATDAGDLQLYMVNDVGTGSDTNANVDIPALAANTWTRVQLSNIYDSEEPSQYKDDMEKVGLYQKADLGAFPYTIEIWNMTSLSTKVTDANSWYSSDGTTLYFVMCFSGVCSYCYFEGTTFATVNRVTTIATADGIWAWYVVPTFDGIFYISESTGYLYTYNDVTDGDPASYTEYAVISDSVTFLGLSDRGWDFDAGNQLLLGTTKGLYQVYTGDSASRSKVSDASLMAVGNFKNYKHWRGYDYWISNGQLFAWDNISLHNISPVFLTSESFTNHGEVKAICHDDQWMYVAVDPLDSTQSDGRAQARILKLRYELVDGSPEWNYHGCIARFAKATELSVITTMEVYTGTAGNPNLYIGGEDTTGEAHVFVMELPLNPNDPGVTRNGSAIMEYSGMTGEFPTTNKMFRSIRVDSENLDANNYLTIKYRVTPHDGENGGTTGWTTLATTFTTSPTQTIDLPAGVNGEALWIRAESTHKSGDPTPKYNLIQANARVADDTDGTGNDREISLIADLSDHRIRNDGARDTNSRAHIVAQLEYLRTVGTSFAVKERFSGSSWNVTYVKPYPIYSEFETYRDGFHAGAEIKLLEV